VRLLNKTINLRLKALRVGQELTQEKMAGILGIHEATYNRKEQGTSEFTLSEAKKISELFGITIDKLFFVELVPHLETIKV